jgi:hypothetical protein
VQEHCNACTYEVKFSMEINMDKHQLAAILSALVMSAGLPALAADQSVRNVQVSPGADSPGGGADTTAAGAKTGGTDQAAKKTWTQEEAMKAGITAEQFKAADTNHDGKLDEQELNAAGLLPKK